MYEIIGVYNNLLFKQEADSYKMARELLMKLPAAATGRIWFKNTAVCVGIRAQLVKG